MKKEDINYCIIDPDDICIFEIDYTKVHPDELRYIAEKLPNAIFVQKGTITSIINCKRGCISSEDLHGRINESEWEDGSNWRICGDSY